MGAQGICAHRSCDAFFVCKPFRQSAKQWPHLIDDLEKDKVVLGIVLIRLTCASKIIYIDMYVEAKELLSFSLSQVFAAGLVDIFSGPQLGQESEQDDCCINLKSEWDQVQKRGHVAP